MLRSIVFIAFPRVKRIYPYHERGKTIGVDHGVGGGGGGALRVYILCIYICVYTCHEFLHPFACIEVSGQAFFEPFTAGKEPPVTGFQRQGRVEPLNLGWLRPVSGEGMFEWCRGDSQLNHGE